MTRTNSLVGHDAALNRFLSALRAGRATHASLITGPRGVGRRTLALTLAKAFNCDAALEQRPCGDCRSCRLIERSVHPDVRVVQRAPDKKSIALRPSSTSSTNGPFLDNIEFIQSSAQLRPADGRCSVYVILESQELGRDAANRLLKTLEEPGPFVRFVLTATERGAVLETVASRCQEIRLSPVARADIAHALIEREHVAPERAEAIARLASGKVGWAIRAARDPSVLDKHRADLGELAAMVVGTRVERLAIARAMAERWAREPDRVRQILRAWLTWWEDVALVQLGLATRRTYVEDPVLTQVDQVARVLDQTAVSRARRDTLTTIADLDANVNARLVLDVLALGLPSASTRAASQS